MLVVVDKINDESTYDELFDPLFSRTKIIDKKLIKTTI